MVYFKSTIIFLSCFILFIQNKRERTTINISGVNPESLNGVVKRLITVDKSLTGIFSPVDTVYFDKEGNIIALNGREKLGKMIVRFTNEYNKNGQKLKSVAMLNEYAFGHLDNSSKMVYRYNNLGYITSSEDYCQSKHICDTNLYKYNQNNELIELKNSNGSGVEFSEDFKYSNHLLTDVISYFYDDKGGKTQQKDSYKYLSFDKHGNWTKRIELISAEKEWMVSRKIAYY